MLSSLGWVLPSADTREEADALSGADAAAAAVVPFSQPGLVATPRGFVTLVLVSRFARKSSTCL
ncbi:MAG: hypothetical protein SGJ09_05915 [Phycisphaerae bacterium]|nr:hypothetical protein [Phycisphaerae bacterium]